MGKDYLLSFLCAAHTDQLCLSVDRNLNAFLNSGEGGTVFLGVMDTGKIIGLPMSNMQVHHIFFCELKPFFNP